jgi:hypothetical protein
MNLSKNQSELLASRLKGWNLLEKGIKISLFCKHNKLFFSLQKAIQCTVIKWALPRKPLAISMIKINDAHLSVPRSCV